MLRVASLYSGVKHVQIPMPMYDNNPRFGVDDQYVSTAQRVSDLLWETCGHDLSSIPDAYLETLYHEYSDGRVSQLPLLNKLNLGDAPTYEEFSEAVRHLTYGEVNPTPFEYVEEIPAYKLGQQPDLDFSEFNLDDEYSFAEEDMGPKVEKFLKKVISSVYTDGVTRVTDKSGKPPSAANNFLMSEDGSEFTGLFFDAVGKKKFPFKISESGGNWNISY